MPACTINNNNNDNDGEEDGEMLACRSSGNPGSCWGGLQPLVRELFEPLLQPTVLLLLLPSPVAFFKFSLSDHSLISKLDHSCSNSAAVKNWTRAQSAMNTVVMMELAMWNLAMKAIGRTGASDG